jgi:hypothetical protein
MYTILLAYVCPPLCTDYACLAVIFTVCLIGGAESARYTSRDVLLSFVIH